MDRVISVEYAIKDDDDRRNANSPNGGRDRSPRRRSDDRGRSPSPYRRERGSPDYGRGRDRGSPDYGRGRGRSPSPQRRGGRGSPDYGRASPVLNGRERNTSPNGKVRNADYRRDASPSPRRERERSPPPRHGRGSISKERERISPEYEQGAIVSPRSEGRITPDDSPREASPDAKRDSPGYSGAESPPDRYRRYIFLYDVANYAGHVKMGLVQNKYFCYGSA